MDGRGDKIENLVMKQCYFGEITFSECFLINNTSEARNFMIEIRSSEKD
jgi:hypothetical protein